MSNEDKWKAIMEKVAFMKQFSHKRGPYVRCEVAKIIDPGKSAVRVCGPEGS